MTEITKEVKKIFSETLSIIMALYVEARDHTNDWKKNLEHPTKKSVETRMNHLVRNSRPPLSDEKKLGYDLSGLEKMLIKIFSGLPGLVDEKGKVNEGLLTLLTNTSKASIRLKLEKLENETEEDEGEEKIVIPTEEEFYELLKKVQNGGIDSKDKEIDRLNIALDEKERQNAELREKLASLEAKEADRNNQSSQVKETKEQISNEVESKLKSIELATAFPEKLTDEELNNLQNTELREMKNWLTNGTEEQKEVIEEKLEKIKKLSSRLKLEKERRNAGQRIADNFADKGEKDPEKRVEVKEEELLEGVHINYLETLSRINDLSKIIEFEIEVSQAISEVRQIFVMMNKAFSRAKQAISEKDVGKAKNTKEILVDFCNLLRKSDPDIYRIYLKKSDDFFITLSQLDSLIKKEKTGKGQEKAVIEAVQSSTNK